MTTVDDILAARPSLKRRARGAADAAREAREQANYEQEQDLLVRTCQWLGTVAKCSPAEIEDIEFERGAYNSAGDKRQLTFTVDDIVFRSYFANAADQIDLTVQMRKSGGTWLVVKSLADIGAGLT